MRSPTVAPSHFTPDRRSNVLLRPVSAWLLAWLQAHWLLLLNMLLGALIGVAALVPLLFALGAMDLAGRIFAAYHLICAQIPSHSYFLFGYQMALCSRNLAIYSALFAGSVAFRSVRGWLAPLDWKLWLLTMIPIALDGGTQLVGWRESNWALRTLTGLIFGLGVCWFLLPHLEEVLGGEARQAPRDSRYPATPQTDVSTKAAS